jgi:hypothetical protein
MPSYLDRLLQWANGAANHPLAPALSQAYQQQAQDYSHAAQMRQNNYIGPESEGHNAFWRFGNGVMSVMDEAGSLGSHMLAGAAGMNPGQALMTGVAAIAPEARPLASAAFGAQAGPGFWSSAHDAVHAPTPDNVQNAALGALPVVGALFGAAAPTGPVGAMTHAMPEAPMPNPAQPFAEWPENYRQAATQMTGNNGGGANYSAGDLAALKAKYGIADAPGQMVGAPRQVAPNVAPEQLPNWMHMNDADFAQQYPNQTFKSGMPPNLEALYQESAGFQEPTPDIGARVRSQMQAQAGPGVQADLVHISPQMYLQKIGAGDPSSILQSEADHATVNHFRERYQNGEPVEPSSIVHDKNGNVIDADGRHRALAAAQAGIDRIPVKVTNPSVPDKLPSINYKLSTIHEPTLGETQ